MCGDSNDTCEACEAAVDPAVAPSDIVVNALCVVAHTSTSGNFGKNNIPRTNLAAFFISPRALFRRVCCVQRFRCVC